MVRLEKLRTNVSWYSPIMCVKRHATIPVHGYLVRDIWLHRRIHHIPVGRWKEIRWKHCGALLQLLLLKHRRALLQLMLLQHVRW